MSSEEILSSTNETESGGVESLTSSEEVSTETQEENNIIEDEVSEVTTETTQEVIYQVADLTKVENSLEIITCFVIFFSVFLLGSMVYKLVKDIF